MAIRLPGKCKLFYHFLAKTASVYVYQFTTDVNRKIIG